VLEVFLCCSPADLNTARIVAERLERTAEVTVAVDDSTTGSVAERWEGGLSSAAILLLLSPHSVPTRVSRTDWEAVLHHIAGNAGPPIGFLLIGECGYPRLLERKGFFRWDPASREVLRGIEEWVMRLHLLPERQSFIAAPLPWFAGRENELAALWEKLVDRAGAAVIQHAGAGGKTSLAQEFARQAGSHFRDILWLDCGDRSPASIAGDLAEGLGIACGDGSEEDFDRLAEVAGRHRVLLVFDDLRQGLKIPVGAEGRDSVLVTTRSTRVDAIGIDGVPSVELNIPQDPMLVRLWQAMAVCRPSGFPLDLAAEIAEVGAGQVGAACARLIQGRLVDPFDQAAGRLRLSSGSLAAAGSSLEAQQRRHAEVVHAAIHDWTSGRDRARQYITEIMPAFRWAATADWSLAGKLANKAYAYLRSSGRLAEGVDLLIALRNAAESIHDWEVSDECSWELSWVLNKPFRRADRGTVGGDQLGLDFGA
jgi:NB-ARC domain